MRFKQIGKGILAAGMGLILLLSTGFAAGDSAFQLNHVVDVEDSGFEYTIHALEIGGHKIKIHGDFLFIDPVEGKELDSACTFMPYDSFISDGESVYCPGYTGWIFKVDLDTKEETCVVYDMDAGYIRIMDCYKQYLYYAYESNRDNVMAPGQHYVDKIAIYDMEKKEKVFVDDIDDWFNITLEADHLYAEMLQEGEDGLETVLKQFALDGSNPKIIGDNARLEQVYGNKVVYQELGNEYGSQVMSYNIDTERYIPLTDWCFQGGFTQVTATGANRYRFDRCGFIMLESQINYPYPIINVSIDGTFIDLDGYNNVTAYPFAQYPYKAENRIFLPVRKTFEAMGYTLEWKEDTQIAKAVKGDNFIEVQLENPDIRYEINGVTGIYASDVVPEEIDGTMFVPVRAIAESAGYDVTWDESESTVLITSK